MASKAVLDLIVALHDNASRGLATIGGGIANVATLAAGAGLAVAGTLAAGLGAAAVSGLRFNSSMEQVEAQLNAFLKDGALVGSTLEMIKRRAAATPFAFEDMARATTSLIPAAKASGQAIEGLLETAEILAASNPAEGLEGAAFALKEALSGDFTSIIERFNLPRARLKELREQGVPDIEAVRIAMQELGLDTSLVTNLANTASGRWSTFMDTLTGLAATATGGLFEGLSATLGDINARLADPAVQAALTAVAEAIGTRLAGAFNWLINTGAPALMAAWGLIRDAVITFQQALAGDWVDSGIIHPFHRVIGVIGQVVAAFQQGGLQGVIDTLLPYLQTGFNNLVAWVQAQAAPLLASFVAWKDAFLAWIAPATAEFLLRWPFVLNDFLDWIAQAAGPILAQLGEWALAFAEWIIPMIPDLLLKLGAVLAAILLWMVETSVVLGAKLVTDWIPAFLGWITSDLIPRLWPALQGAEDAILGWIKSAAGSVLTVAGKIGDNIAQGIINSLNAAGGRLAAAATNAAQSVAGSIAGFFGIRSPSRLMEQYGDFLGQGLARGLERATAGAVDAANSLSRGVAGTMLAPAPLALAGAPAGGASLPTAGLGGGGVTIIVNLPGLTIANGQDRAVVEQGVSDAAYRGWLAARNAGTRQEGGG